VAVALDSSVVVGFLDRSDLLHGAADEAVRGLLREQPLVASAITYAELMTGARLGHHDEGQVRGFFEELVSRLLVVDVGVADEAARLRAVNRSLRMPDALIAASVESDPEVDLLVSGDRNVAKIKGLACDVRLLAA
jgi:predicted nucleic acid-binding protein